MEPESQKDSVQEKKPRRFIGKARKNVQGNGGTKKDSGGSSGQNELIAIEDAGKKSGSSSRRVMNLIPQEIMEDKGLNEAIAILPKNYNFEIHKSVWQLRKNNSKRVALQFPEGLLLYSVVISDILEKYAEVETVIMGNVTYGACCIDDYSAIAMGCDFMIHYGHSCLIPISQTKVKTLYVFVEIGIDLDHFVETIRVNFPKEDKVKLGFVGVVQFISTLHLAKEKLKDEYEIIIPQVKPLSPGEILGCTSPRLKKGDVDHVVFLGDGRFHLESILIHNPEIKHVYGYDPYKKKMTIEGYDHEEMHKMRLQAIEQCKQNVKTVGLILGTLGRQGSNKVMEELINKAKARGINYVVVLTSEITVQKLKEFDDVVDFWVQVACPRLSIDWGYAFSKPLLNSYEAAVVLKSIEWQSIYPMDYYSNQSLGNWTPNFK
ncbi:Diphthamide biosynthesis protein 1 [Zancudomyces culisetae]|uniref:2-(3-amino-3-carboxypropyl)histidine synthase subunit 1 n=1 Tax=Zancudomyces culisetae TaxID=1213189 RepID=A0A1R1PKC6_ZANCU|nr:Diphthamide biosynthesis protein 1 [Zancudomyces culisetae]|eukprot:OMH81428.1 Diphthamide biosynthesis protein 1 [Zancudomyces culisetae]